VSTEKWAHKYPLFTNMPAGGDSGYVVPAQVDTMKYDAVGRVLIANNGDAKVSRSYYPGGFLKSDTTRVRTLADTSSGGDFTHHVYGVNYSYDLAGRVTTLTVPNQIAPRIQPDTLSAVLMISGQTQSIKDQIAYTYDTGTNGTGWLLRVDGLLPSDVFRYGYAPRGEIATLSSVETAPDGPTALPVHESRGYDDDGSLITQQVLRTNTAVTDTLRRASMTVDAEGRVLVLRDSAKYASSITRDSAVYLYSGLGQMLSSDYETRSPDGFTALSATEGASYDALGNWVARSNAASAVFSAPGGGSFSGTHATRSARYISASSVRRTVWDGNQELAEIEMPATDSTASTTIENDTLAIVRSVPGTGDALFDANRLYGQVLYVNGLETDQPLAITRNHYADASSTTGSATYAVYAPFSIVPLWNSQGRADRAVIGATAAPGQDYLCTDTGKTRCAEVFLDHGVFPYARSGAAMGSWNGTVLVDKADATGTYYRRNRSYDPATARFTQEDPIGLAGGLNAYGFASGDPANYSDPFGLCTDANGKELPASKCRDVSTSEGASIYNAAVASGKWTYTLGGAGEPAKDVCHKIGDCTDFSERAMEDAELPAISPTVRTHNYAESSNFRALKAGEEVQQGDIVIQGGHAGVLNGKRDRRGRLLGIQNGKHGVSTIPWGRGVRGLDDADPIIYR
jgi:RHS repeat-associated protein